MNIILQNSEDILACTSGAGQILTRYNSREEPVLSVVEGTQFFLVFSPKSDKINQPNRLEIINAQYASRFVSDGRYFSNLEYKRPASTTICRVFEYEAVSLFYKKAIG